MNKIFVEADCMAGGAVRIGGETAHHIRNVLRMRPGEALLVSCGDEWEYTCTITAVSEDGITAAVTDAQRPGRELPSRIVLLQCLPKGDKMETVIQKAVELGAAEIVPVASRRCVVRLDAKKAAAKVKRWNAVAANAAEQAMRMAVPSVQEVMELPAALAYAAAMTSPGGAEPVLLMPYERARDMAQTRRILGQIRPGQTVAVLIGPEGGFEEPEAAQVEAAGFAPVTLGKRILRTETAGMAVLSVLAYLLEEDGGPS